ncbi:tyrosine kinase family catalytic domain protein, partial [Rhizoctonia solani AG-3 Rhs1AP]
MFAYEGHEYSVSSVAFSPDGKSIASGSDDHTIRIWDAHSLSSIGEPLRGHDGSIKYISYSPLDNIIASGSEDKTIRLWDVNTCQQLGGPLFGNHRFYSVAFSPDAKLIASGCGGYLSRDPSANTVQLWDVQKMTAASNLFKGHAGAINSVHFSPNGYRVASGSNDMTIRVWDVERGTTVVGPLNEHTDWSLVHTMAHSGFGMFVVDDRLGVLSGGNDKTVRVWDIRTGRQVELFEEHTDLVYSVAFSPCGQYVASGSADRKVIIRNITRQYPEVAIASGPQIIDSQMSTQQIFDCLIGAGCTDLSLQMDTRQETAMIASGGGFGDIWKGKLYDGGKVAIKAWRTSTLEQCDYKTLKRAARELFYWSRMEHPNIHRLQGVIMFRDQYLGMVSEWMENGNLHEYLRKQPSADRYQLCIHVASGLEYMHSCNTVHGDLKALNVLVSSDGVAKLSDFDFSIMSEASTLVFSESSNSRLGSLRWTAPEMLLEEVPKRTTQSDIYALGMTMLEIFTGEVPYPNCRQDFLVLKTVEKGTLPNRPLERLKDDKQGNMVWQLLLDCWSRDVSVRPSSKQVLDTMLSLVSSA